MHFVRRLALPPFIKHVLIRLVYIGLRADAVAVATSVESGITPSANSPTGPAPTTAETQSVYAQQLAEVPEFAEYGAVLKSSGSPIPLTESEMEYVTTCVKHIFMEHVVFQVHFSSLSFLLFSSLFY